MEEHETSPARTPLWFPIILGFQFFIAVIILGLSAYIIHGKYFDTLGFTIFLSLLTWLVVVYHFATIYVVSLKEYRIQYAVLASDAVMVIFWLSAMGASAALRASFRYRVTVDGCYNNGGLVNSETCVVERSMEKRGAVANSTGLSILSAIAGLSALEMLLYIACLVLGVLIWNKSRSKASTVAYAPQKQNEGYQMEAPPQLYAQQTQPVVQQQPYVQQSYNHGPDAPGDKYSLPQTQPPYKPEEQYSHPQAQPHAGYQPNLPVY